jgi:hypothetical protein
LGPILDGVALGGIAIVIRDVWRHFRRPFA